MRSLLALSLLLACYVDKSYATFTEFMNNLPSEVANSFRSAWTSISDAIKKPVKIKRLGPGGKMKTTAPPASTELPDITPPKIAPAKSITPRKLTTVAYPSYVPSHHARVSSDNAISNTVNNKSNNVITIPFRTSADYFMATTSRHRNYKLTLPLLATPKYKSLDEWKQMERARNGERKTIDSKQSFRNGNNYIYPLTK